MLGGSRLGLKLHIAQAASQRHLVSAPVISLRADASAFVVGVYEHDKSADRNAAKDQQNESGSPQRWHSKHHAEQEQANYEVNGLNLQS